MAEHSKHEFQAFRPFGPTIFKGSLPESLIKLLDDKATEIMENDKMSKECDHSMHLAGNVKQEVRFPPAWLISTEFAPMNTSLQMIIEKYLEHPPMINTVSPDKVEKIMLTSIWCVSQWAGDFNPSHVHDGDLSGVIYLRIPPSLKKEYEKEDHYPCVGDIEFSCGQAATFNGHQFQATPEVGDIFLFPSWLSHCVYPFRTPNEERRSVSFNVSIKRKRETGEEEFAIDRP